MLYQVIEDGQITESYSMPDHDDTHHLVTAGKREAITTVNTTRTLENGFYTVKADASSGAITLILPEAALYPGRIYNIKKIDASANTVTIIGWDGLEETIDGDVQKVITNQWECYTVHCDGIDWYII